MALIAWWLMLCMAFAHDVRPGVIALQEVSEDTHTVRIAGERWGRRRCGVAARWPAGCVSAADTLRCEDGLSGELAVPAAAIQKTPVVVQVQHLDGSMEREVLRGSRDSAQLGGAFDAGACERMAGCSPRAGRLGPSLVLVGPCFGDGLLAGAGRRGHGVCVGMVWRWCGVPAGCGCRGRALELLIALSIFCVALEAASESKTSFAGRVGWVSAGFGLVHGLGFAVSMLEGGATSPWTLLWFNVGVEVGQLAVLCALFVVAPW